MNRITRRALLLAGAGGAALAALPLLRNGTVDFLWRTLREHFGDEITGVAGLEEFVSEFAALKAGGSLPKRVAAELYFSWRGDRLHMIGPAEDLREQFLNTLLVRSNIIAVVQVPGQEFDYTIVDPWEPTCGLYLSSLAETRL